MLNTTPLSLVFPQNSVTAQHRYCATATSLRNSATAQQCHCTTVSLHNSVTAQQRHCATATLRKGSLTLTFSLSSPPSPFRKAQTTAQQILDPRSSSSILDPPRTAQQCHCATAPLRKQRHCTNSATTTAKESHRATEQRHHASR